MKTMLSFFTGLFLILLANSSICAEFSGGTGTETDPFLISTVEELDAVREYLGPDHSAVYFRLTADIDLGVAPYNQGNGWTPIGTTDDIGNPNAPDAFYGHFDAADFKIKNLMINTDASYQGLFGYAANAATFDSVEIVECNITAGSHTGGLLGATPSSASVNINKCIVNGSVSGTGYVGGIVGSMSGVITLTSTNCVVQSSTDDYTGGIAGEFRGRIGSCHAMGNVLSEGSLVGGVVGWLEGNIDSSYATGSVLGMNRVGGLIGRFNSGKAVGVYSTANVDGVDYVGGLVGFNVGVVDSSYCKTGKVAGDNYVGGLAGWNQSRIKHCTAACTVKANFNNAGGFVGYNETDSEIYQCMVDQVTVAGADYTAGFVGKNYATLGECSSAASVNGDNFVGGLVGVNNSADITNCYASGNVESTLDKIGGLVGENYKGNLLYCYASGSVKGKTYVGGLVGWSGNTDGGSINSCAANNTSVDGTASVNRIIGYNSSSNGNDLINNVAWAGMPVNGDLKAGTADNVNGDDKGLNELQKASTYTSMNWSFTSVWQISKDTFPVFKWQSNGGIFDSDIVLVNVYPNPTSSSISIEHDKIMNKISLFSMSGELLQVYENINDCKYMIDISSYPLGTYIIDIDKEAKANFIIIK